MMDYFEFIFTEEGRRKHEEAMAALKAAERARWRAGRFHRDADNHDWRIPHKTRVAVLERANERCESCGRFVYCGVLGGLEIHHETYERAYGEELPADLKVLCRACHKTMHGRGERS